MPTDKFSLNTKEVLVTDEETDKLHDLRNIANFILEGKDKVKKEYSQNKDLFMEWMEGDKEKNEENPFNQFFNDLCRSKVIINGNVFNDGKAVGTQEESLQLRQKLAVQFFPPLVINNRQPVNFGYFSAFHQGTMRDVQAFVDKNYTLKTKKGVFIPFESTDPEIDPTKKRTIIMQRNGSVYSYKYSADVYVFLDSEGQPYCVKNKNNEMTTANLAHLNRDIENGTIKPIFRLTAEVKVDYTKVPVVVSVETAITSKNPALRYVGPKNDPAVVQLGNIDLGEQIKRSIAKAISTKKTSPTAKKISQKSLNSEQPEYPRVPLLIGGKRVVRPPVPSIPPPGPMPPKPRPRR